MKYYKNDPDGNRSGAASTIWRFTNTVEGGDLVVGSIGRDKVASIGVIRSDYIAPKSKSNPIRNEHKSTHRLHVRLVDWWYKGEPIELKVKLPRKFFFAIPTLQELSPVQFAEIELAIEASAGKMKIPGNSNFEKNSSTQGFNKHPIWLNLQKVFQLKSHEKFVTRA